MTAKYERFQDFLDEVQYSKEGVARYEWIFGETFLSTGGLKTTEEVLSRVDLKQGDRVLDIGSGIGGHAFTIAEKYGAQVDAVDLSRNMMAVALDHLERRPQLKDKVRFRICDVTTTDFDEGVFSLIYSRDALLHIKDKKALFAKFYKLLKPGGKVLFTDYTRGTSECSDEFEDYVANRGYHLLTVKNYEELMKDTGFVNVQALDWKDKFDAALNWELKKLRNQRGEFLQKFQKQDFEYLENGWMAKLKRIEEGDQSWVLGYAEKAAN